MENATENPGRMQESNSNSPALDNTIMVYKDHGTRNVTTYNHSQSIPQTSWNQSKTSTLSETSDVGLINLEPVSSTASISSDAQAIISAAWKNTTKTKYNSTFKRWINCCSKRNINSLQPNAVNIIEFLTEEFKRVLSYNSLVSARSALGQCLSCDIIHHSTVCKHKDISTFYDISKKLATLFMILAGTRVNTLVHLKVTNMYITDTEVTFTFDEVLKHSRPNYKEKPLILRSFTSKDFCPVTTLITYLEHRLPASGDPALFITTVRPHQKASKDSISRWIKLTMSEAGINFGLFTSHSCRSASTSKAIEANIDLKLYNLKVSKLVWKFDIQKTLPLRDTARISTS